MFDNPLGNSGLSLGASVVTACYRDQYKRASGSLLAGSCTPEESNSLEAHDGAGVEDAVEGVDLFIDEMADVGVGFDIEFCQQVEITGRGVDLRGDLGIGDLVGDLVGLAELALDLNEEGNHARGLLMGPV